MIDEIIFGDYKNEVIFMKQMTHHLIDIDESFLEKVINVFLIRNPKQLISSLAQVLPKVTMRDTGIERQYELYNFLKSKKHSPVVVDSGEILKDPEKVLTKLCNELEILFDKNMLQWTSGPRKEDGVWGKYWYENVHNSTGFSSQKTSSRDLPEELIGLYNECKPFYEIMYKHSIKA